MESIRAAVKLAVQDEVQRGAARASRQRRGGSVRAAPGRNSPAQRKEMLFPEHLWEQVTLILGSFSCREMLGHSSSPSLPWDDAGAITRW